MTHYAPLIGALTTLLVLTFILTVGKRAIIHDIPNERSLHTKPVPRMGGIALLAGVLVGWLMLTPFWSWWIMLPTLGLFLLSLLDDIRNLSARTRLIVHFMAALIALSGANISLLWLIPLLLFIVWMTNLYNFMDGSDGLAGGMALFGFGSYGVGAWLSGNEGFALLNFSIASAALSFLLFNFHPARIFMGDAGSIPLGFLAATLGIYGWQDGIWPLWFPLLTFSPFIADATLTLYQRKCRGEKLSQAHRSHYYQRLVQMGWGHRNTALSEYALMLLAGATALQARNATAENQIWLLLCWIISYGCLSMWIDHSWR
ncbi:MAG TPA: glycosyltransferase family 4 protein, partial [Gallionella sp.]|nr:glycosyltransferase family 4 protein [Gallionella sp.]